MVVRGSGRRAALILLFVPAGLWVLYLARPTEGWMWVALAGSFLFLPLVGWLVLRTTALIVEGDQATFEVRIAGFPVRVSRGVRTMIKGVVARRVARQAQYGQVVSFEVAVENVGAVLPEKIVAYTSSSRPPVVERATRLAEQLGVDFIDYAGD